MSTKRTLGDGEESPHPKRQLSTLEIAIEIEEEMKSNKRKINTLGTSVVESDPKSPKKSIERPVSSNSNVQPIEYIEILDDIVSAPSAAVSSSSVPTKSTSQRAPVVIQRPGAKVTNGQVHHIEAVSRDDDAIKPSAPVPPRAVSVSTPTPGDSHIPVPTGVMSNHSSHNRDELHQLWSQFCVAMDTCISTVTPLFLTMILALYLVSAVTKSQTIASIGLVYVFVFLMLLFSYFAAIVPFILVSNAICSSLAPTGNSPQKDFIRLSVLMCSIGVVVGYFKYGKTAY